MVLSKDRTATGLINDGSSSTFFVLRVVNSINSTYICVVDFPGGGLLLYNRIGNQLNLCFLIGDCYYRIVVMKGGGVGRLGSRS